MLTNQQSQADSCKNKDLDVHHASSIILGDTSSTGGGGGGSKKITHKAHDRLGINRSKSKFSAFKPVTPTG
jgi:hypothetical protein